jgi:hypothetical protein
MSHYLDFKTKITDRDALVKALCHMKTSQGLLTVDKIEVHDKATNLYGYQGDKRNTVANVIIRRNNVGGAANDIGFVKNADGTYSSIISEYDSGYQNDEWQKKLYTYYNFEKAKFECVKKGLSVTEGLTADGRLTLRARFKSTSTNAIHL